ncbi:MAG: PTS system mannose/fructose/sorbose family transporter subunit IID, partial [Clostridium sp.]|uniref:PTS system mannose/fructose/sorbose family transporter subunit IID n=1 Tax=Clostridium sp. TaxID=1506 RepID=UPI003F36EDE7
GHDKEEYKDMLHTHNQFFNTSAFFGNLILGIDLAIEEKEGYSSKETVTSIKTALMGSLAGVGDSLLHVIWATIWGSITATLALNGSPLGIILWTLANCGLIALRWSLLPIGYKQGTKIVTTLKDKLNVLTNAATVLGVTVIGALIPTVVRANVPFVYKNDQVSLVVQDVLNQIMPSLVPVLLLGLVYWLLGKKKMNSTRVIWLMLILSIVLYNLGILA